VFAKTAEWIEDNRLECATFHILTPYPGTPLFRQMEAEGRLLHRNWDLYDTAHAVFRPRHMTAGPVGEGQGGGYGGGCLRPGGCGRATGGRCYRTWACRTCTRRRTGCGRT